MRTLREILATHSVEEMKTVLSANPRKFREELFKRFGIKARSTGGGGFKLSAKGDSRSKKFIELLQSPTEISDEVLTEIVRNHLYLKRSMLADALNHLDVPNDNGLTDQELDFVQELSEDAIERLEDVLVKAGHSYKDITLYLVFLGAKS